jgi:hypothetical protein
LHRILNTYQDINEDEFMVNEEKLVPTTFITKIASYQGREPTLLMLLSTPYMMTKLLLQWPSHNSLPCLFSITFTRPSVSITIRVIGLARMIPGRSTLMLKRLLKKR